MAKNAIILGVGLADNVSKQLDTMASKLRARARNLASVGSELTMGLTLPIVAAGGATLKFAADLDALKKALAATMGSASGAEAEFLKLKEAAKAPGIGLEEAIKGSFLLQGLGESADGARRQMLALAKAVALSGGGEAQFGGVMQQFTQMKGVGKILGGDIRFMIENAPILAKVLNDAFGTANPERIRDMGVSVDTLIEKMVTGLEGMEGIGGSLKNNLENLWTSIRIGVGEIGLAALGATNWDKAIETLSDTVTEITGRVRDWIKANPELTKTILKTLAAMAITGPFIRFFADMGLAISTVGQFGSALTKIPGLLLNIDKAAKTISLTAFSWIGVVTAAIIGLTEAANALDDAMYKNPDGSRKVRTDPGGRKYTHSFGSEVALGVEGRQYLPDAITQQQKDSAKGLLDGFLNAANAAVGTKTPSTIIKKKKPLPTQKDKKDKGPYLYEGNDITDFEGMTSTPSDFNPAEGMGKGKFMTGPVGGVPFGIDTEFLDKIRTAKDITKEFEQAIKDAGLAQDMGATETEVMGMKVDALGEKYRQMASVYEEGDSRRTTALAEFISMNDTYLQKLKEIKAEEEKKNQAVQYGMMLMGGIGDTFAAGIKGAKGFGIELLKAAAAMIKLAIATWVQKQLAIPGIGGITAVIGGGALIGIIDGIMSKVSLAKGGVLTGESMVRAGEYPGVAANPEVISPVSVIQKYIKQAVSEGGGGGGGYSVIRGKDIHIVAGMHERVSTRIGGPSIVG